MSEGFVEVFDLTGEAFHFYMDDKPEEYEFTLSIVNSPWQFQISLPPHQMLRVADMIRDFVNGNEKGGD